MNGSTLFIPVVFALTGLAVAFMPASWRKARAITSVYASFLALVAAVLFAVYPSSFEFSSGWFPTTISGGFNLRIDSFAAIFGVLMTSAFFVFFIFSSAISTKKSSALYLVAAAAAAGAVFSADFFTLLVFWGVILAALYLVLQDTDEPTAQRAMVVLGVSDFAMLLGVVLMARLSGTYDIAGAMARLPEGNLSMIALALIAFGAIAKTGSMPFHNWIISATSKSSVGTLIIFPAIIDKVLGIYLLARILPAMRDRADVFQPVLITIGALTLILSVLKALAQHDLKKLLAYHSVSQVGYMILGVATFHPVGVLGGIFHMFNNVVYKSGLLMGAGAVEKATGTTEMSRLGSLSSKMPATFGSMLVSSLAISGVPPLNGFVSKWLIFHGLLAAAAVAGNRYILVALFVAMAGSSLTLASFLKVIHSVFLARAASAADDSNKSSALAADSNIALRAPQIIMASASVALGAFATIYVGIPMLVETSYAAILMVIAAAIAGAAIYQFKISRRVRRADIFFGGEEYRDEYVFGGGDFYKTVEKLGWLAGIYSVSSRSREDDGGFYALVTKTIRAVSSALYYSVERVIYLLQLFLIKAVEGVIFVLRLAHTGELYVYLSWYLVGAAALLWILAP
ncbi:MAG: proton-conducting transporter membrane subunit [Endomicrobiia bacterium]|nr:proton-conducting transporter membrane subunit [Endomicrobiia bacterium]